MGVIFSDIEKQIKDLKKCNFKYFDKYDIKFKINNLEFNRSIYAHYSTYIEVIKYIESMYKYDKNDSYEILNCILIDKYKYFKILEKIKVKIYIDSYKTVYILKNEKDNSICRINFDTSKNKRVLAGIDNLQKPLEDDDDFYFEQVTSLKNHLKNLGYSRVKFVYCN